MFLRVIIKYTQVKYSITYSEKMAQYTVHLIALIILIQIKKPMCAIDFLSIFEPIEQSDSVVHVFLGGCGG